MNKGIKRLKSEFKILPKGFFNDSIILDILRDTINKELKNKNYKIKDSSLVKIKIEMDVEKL